MEGYRLLDDGEALRRSHHLADIIGVVIRSPAVHGKTQAAVIYHDAVAHTYSQQLVDGKAGRLPGAVHERHLDGADRAVPRLEGAEATRAHHATPNIGRTSADDNVEEQ